MEQKEKAADCFPAEYYESRRRFLIKVAEARKRANVVGKKINPLTLCPAGEY